MDLSNTNTQTRIKDIIDNNIYMLSMSDMKRIIEYNRNKKFLTNNELDELRFELMSRVVERNHSKYPHVSSYGRKNIKKQDFRKIIAYLAIITGIAVGGVKINKGIENKNKVSDITNNLETSIETVYERANSDVINGTSVINNDALQSVYYNISKSLTKNYNISRDASFYIISEKYGKQAFDLVTKAFSYKDSEQFLYKEYPKFIDRAEGRAVDREGSYKEFSKKIKAELLNKYDDIQRLYVTEERTIGK